MLSGVSHVPGIGEDKFVCLVIVHMRNCQWHIMQTGTWCWQLVDNNFQEEVAFTRTSFTKVNFVHPSHSKSLRHLLLQVCHPYTALMGLQYKFLEHIVKKKPG